ncbi:MAG: 50S ribosomal protein L6 [Candidatus Omnitrophica bacterium]|nr:50S ribosomal protein L6 [Candidatus Omnitrophota bacterium]MDD5355167.1 50S ribosomal protein L6 [Candidatus Omnitrophota bacterium]
MSRIGKKPIVVPKEVKVDIAQNRISVEGKNGKMEFVLAHRISAELKDGILKFKSVAETKLDKTMLGTSRAIVNNMIIGVNQGYEKRLEIIGVGFRAQMEKNNLNMQLGFTHPVLYTPLEGVKVETPKPNQIVIKGIDKVKVGQVAAEIRAFRPPEPYKGKGIRYAGEYVRKKLGKAVAKAAA